MALRIYESLINLSGKVTVILFLFGCFSSFYVENLELFPFLLLATGKTEVLDLKSVL